MSDAVTGAIIGASIATIGLIVAKEGKTSEFRQQWIDGLRSDVATCISLAFHISTTNAENAEDLRTANECLARIRLRLNMEEQESTQLIDALNQLQHHAGIANSDLEPFADLAVQKTQIILKTEWRRVKRGEWRYRIILSIALVALCSSFGVIIFHWLKG